MYILLHKGNCLIFLKRRIMYRRRVCSTILCKVPSPPFLFIFHRFFFLPYSGSYFSSCSSALLYRHISGPGIVIGYALIALLPNFESLTLRLVLWLRRCLVMRVFAPWRFFLGSVFLGFESSALSLFIFSFASHISFHYIAVPALSFSFLGILLPFFVLRLHASSLSTYVSFACIMPFLSASASPTCIALTWRWFLHYICFCSSLFCFFFLHFFVFLFFFSNLLEILCLFHKFICLICGFYVVLDSGLQISKFLGFFLCCVGVILLDFTLHFFLLSWVLFFLSCDFFFAFVFLQCLLPWKIYVMRVLRILFLSLEGHLTYINYST